MQIHLLGPHLQIGSDYILTPETLDLLRAIHAHSSITIAARTQNMHYRTAWRKVNELENALQLPVIIAIQGRATYLTPLGKNLLHASETINEACEGAAKPGIAALARLLR